MDDARTAEVCAKLTRQLIEKREIAHWPAEVQSQYQNASKWSDRSILTKEWMDRFINIQRAVMFGGPQAENLPYPIIKSFLLECFSSITALIDENQAIKIKADSLVKEIIQQSLDRASMAGRA
jgi:hypothetical protein